MDSPPPAPGGAYGLVERLHLRQWLLRGVLPIAALATNGSGALDVAWLPRRPLADRLAPAAEDALLVAGALLVAASAGLRVAAKGVLVRKTTLTTGGVYGVVRHPFYLANLLGAVGTFLLAGPLGAALAAAWIVVAAPIYAVTIAGEETALSRLFPGEFAAYEARVRALLPGRPPAGRPATRVTWSNLRTEREPPRLLRFLAGAALVGGLTLAGPAGTAVLAAAGLAFGASYALR